jgi:hypothetical protein
MRLLWSAQDRANKWSVKRGVPGRKLRASNHTGQETRGGGHKQPPIGRLAREKKVKRGEAGEDGERLDVRRQYEKSTEGTTVDKVTSMGSSKAHSRGSRGPGGTATLAEIWQGRMRGQLDKTPRGHSAKATRLCIRWRAHCPCRPEDARIDQ